MAVESKTVQIGSNVDETNGIITHTEADGEWYVDEFRVKTNGDGDGSVSIEYRGIITPQGDTQAVFSSDNPTRDMGNVDNNIDSTATHYNILNMGKYIDFDTEELGFQVDEDDNGTVDVYAHIRRVA